ncbi:MAG: hypothetical protein HY075_03585 [Deltaproteobacteria bacterium]|nr:hypothetical protein [Deltaproteobacteria bacterium]
MRVHNYLPDLLDALKRWERKPASCQVAEYLRPMEQLLAPLALDPAYEEARLKKSIDAVERCLGITLTGDAVLFGAFTTMDGYARFDHGKHCVYLGVDESHGRGAYLDILVAHELAHVAREPLPEIWAGFGKTPDMSHDEFTENLPVIEHLMGEGFSCVVSELLNPREDACHYVYQTEDGLSRVLEHGPAVDRAIHKILKDPKGRYQSLYNTRLYRPELPLYAHYVWAWLWVTRLLEEKAGGNPRILLNMPSHELVEHALKFKLPKAL